MHVFKYLALLIFLFLVFACSKDDDTPTPGGEAGVENSNLATADRVSGSGGAVGGGSSPGTSGGQGGTNQPGTAGLITAGEWNDLENWDFWLGLYQDKEHAEAISGWEMDGTGRYSVIVRNTSGNPVRDVTVELKLAGRAVYSARTNQLGRAELFAEPNASLRLAVAGNNLSDRVKPIAEGENLATVARGTNATQIEVAFIVDATGSMGDELNFLKEDLQAVIEDTEKLGIAFGITTATVFYRDRGDEYVTRHSGFTNDLRRTTDFIKEQSASGGGDWEEAVEEALHVAVNDLEWSGEARARIAFLLLDAPPHRDEQVMEKYRAAVKKAAEKGIRIVPVVASGIDRNTEFLMRLTAIATNGTYVFITDDSGIGDDHLEPTVGDFEVEFLKDLISRLIAEYGF